MNLLNNIKQYSLRFPKSMAARKPTGGGTLTYKELESCSNSLACYLKNNLPNDKSPIIVYGHKDPYMLVLFLACVKASHPYCPIDTSIPMERTVSIIEAVQPQIILTTESLDIEHPKILSLEEIKSICASTERDTQIDITIKDEDVFYILFTSGSTGTPKGVQITAKCLDDFLSWLASMVKAHNINGPLVFLNQAAFSFDLSVMDLYTSLFLGGTSYLLDKETQLDFKKLIPALKGSGVSVWVSTPSFANLCLADRNICGDLLPNLKLLLFCGEVLTNKTALQLMERFPEAKIINTYGPTEATVAVTGQEITREIAQRVEPLPIGRPNPKIQIEIRKENGQPADIGETGEIVIIGDTVAKGYLGQPELTERFFSERQNGGQFTRAYKTGDAGFIDEEENLHYAGRLDNQIKLNGYRIELGDIESNLINLEDILEAAVLPKWQGGKIKNLVAFVTADLDAQESFDERAFSRNVKKQLKVKLPEYMVPKKIIRLDSLPMNSNGKVDRKKLGELIK